MIPPASSVSPVVYLAHLPGLIHRNRRRPRRRRGLLTRKSRGRLPVVWLHAPGKTSWALLHTVKRHGGRVEDVIVFEVNGPASWLRHSSRRGLWYLRRDVPPARLRRLLHFNELAASPLAA